ncbi:APC family permease [Desulfolutivibrio sulfoxidireducens]|uniref:APC family permease n=1 Tax=Desulfolutivibrio sulfoxidireducens TaxID=2773299 RepID=UPI00159DE88E|nr:APC family permease [Desulfolutivibrio sulfoxidireducens]QLA16021.1 amino acid permease [Desulfolutivibrio sulfoxidireducens]
MSAPAPAATPSSPGPKKQIGLFSAIAIGIGGMVGGGVYAIFGTAAGVAGTALWLSFLLGGLVALATSYNYAKLGARYPTRGGAVEFLVRGLGDGIVSGGLNIYMWVGYVIALAMYAAGFAGYLMTFFPQAASPWLPKAVAAGAVLLFAGVNILGAASVGRSELVTVAVNLGVLSIFAVWGCATADWDGLSTAGWAPGTGIVFGGGMLFIAYEGFGLVANAAGDMADPARTLPKALYFSVCSVFVVYLGVSLAVLGHLPLPAIDAARDYALSQAAKTFMGGAGFTFIAVGALFATAAALNATLFGAANVCYMIARDGELPGVFDRMAWKRAPEGLFLTTALVLVFVLFFDLSSVAMMGSGAFLFIYAAVAASHLRLRAATGGRPALIWLSIALCLALLAVLGANMLEHSPSAFWTMLGLLPVCFGLEWAYRKATGRLIAVGTAPGLEKTP